MVDFATCVFAAHCRGRGGEPQRERGAGGMPRPRNEISGSDRGASEGAAQSGNVGDVEWREGVLSYIFSLSESIKCYFPLAVAGAAPEPADPHVPAAAVPGHVPP